ncbi:Tm-1-like ATP-binding domain-containing protein [Agriterribacter sp.]|uniref:Tm-1-like ATP-binding domain-containing protein n=1 Tax=Agriterribacter sp. TaxID=2821509 RepID=UPI002C1D8528|nr:Tm-1-like ATP-binding domain-containing protein [Agriterribacter sp.]HRP55431.1 Tm-1-like ATP-binding domain-containing protein [Agriterribacter sp.]
MSSNNKAILILGCFDTKGEDFLFLRSCIVEHGEKVITMNTGVMETTINFPVDIESDVVALEAGYSIKALRESDDRGQAVSIMGRGAAKFAARLVAQNKIKAAIGMGGGGGTYIALSAMQEIPLSIPKLCLSTLAAKDLSRQMGSKDIVLMPSIVDVAGLNSISRLLIRRAAAAICAMSEVGEEKVSTAAGTIAISMFGNTSDCVNQCSDLLRKQGYEVLAFHANGVGGKTMESLIGEKCFDAVLDVTTTELADDLCGGICSAGPGRLNAAAGLGIPQVVVPGCLDMVNFAQPDTVPVQYQSRDLYNWAPDVTLMRTNKEENKILGERLAQKINRSPAPVKVLLPARGISQIDAPGGVFCRPEINRVLFDAIKENTKSSIEVIETDAHINDPEFSAMLVNALLSVMKKLQV